MWFLLRGRLKAFLFTLALGLAAPQIARVLRSYGQRRRRAGEQPSHARFVRAAIAHYFTADRRHPALTLERPGEPPVDRPAGRRRARWRAKARRPI